MTPMNPADEFLKHAAECQQMAKATRNPCDHNVRSLADWAALGHCENGGVQVVAALVALEMMLSLRGSRVPEHSGVPPCEQSDWRTSSASRLTAGASGFLNFS